MMSSSAPKTRGPSRSRTIPSTGAMSARAAGSVSALAVRRTLISPADARKATVGFADSSKRSSRSSPIFDSDSPQVRRRRLTTTASSPPAWRWRNGRTAPSSMGIISAGTPGRANTQVPSISMHSPGAVPLGLRIISAPSGYCA